MIDSYPSLHPETVPQGALDPAATVPGFIDRATARCANRDRRNGAALLSFQLELQLARLAAMNQPVLYESFEVFGQQERGRRLLWGAPIQDRDPSKRILVVSNQERVRVGSPATRQLEIVSFLVRLKPFAVVASEYTATWSADSQRWQLGTGKVFRPFIYYDPTIEVAELQEYGTRLALPDEKHTSYRAYCDHERKANRLLGILAGVSLDDRVMVDSFSTTCS